MCPGARRSWKLQTWRSALLGFPSRTGKGLHPNYTAGSRPASSESSKLLLRDRKVHVQEVLSVVQHRAAHEPSPRRSSLSRNPPHTHVYVVCMYMLSLKGPLSLQL